MKTRTLQINHPSELNSLTHSRWFRKAGLGAIRLSPEFDHPQKEQWESQINRYYYACGCADGATGLMSLLVLGLIGGFAAYQFDVLTLKQFVAVPIAASIIGAAVGKLSGLAAARRKLTRVVHTVQANWKPLDRTESPLSICG